MAVVRREEPSELVPGQINVFVQAGSLEACQAIIFQVMDDAGQASFTLPTKGADGDYYALGHYHAAAIEPRPDFP